MQLQSRHNCLHMLSVCGSSFLGNHVTWLWRSPGTCFTSCRNSLNPAQGRQLCGHSVEVYVTESLKMHSLLALRRFRKYAIARCYLAAWFSGFTCVSNAWHSAGIGASAAFFLMPWLSVQGMGANRWQSYCSTQPPIQTARTRMVRSPLMLPR